MQSWDDLRYAHAVGVHGSLANAGRALRVDATTVGRRVTALEEALGVVLFIRSGNGWLPTEAGQQVLRAADQAAAAVLIADRVAETTSTPRGIVRVTAIEEVAARMIVPVLPAITLAYPEISVHVVCTTRKLDLGTGEADIAVRLGRPNHVDLIARRLITLRERFYAAPSWLAARGIAAEDLRSLADVPLLQIGGRNIDIYDNLGTPREVTVSNSTQVIVGAVQAGTGVALLPDLVARECGLVALPSLPSLEELPIWLVTHRDLGRVPRVRAVFDAIGAHADSRK